MESISRTQEWWSEDNVSMQYRIERVSGGVRTGGAVGAQVEQARRGQLGHVRVALRMRGEHARRQRVRGRAVRAVLRLQPQHRNIIDSAI